MAKKVNKTLMMIQKEAKVLWATGKFKKYPDAIKKASANLKTQGKL
jgi:hypothetical protein